MKLIQLTCAVFLFSTQQAVADQKNSETLTNIADQIIQIANANDQRDSEVERLNAALETSRNNYDQLNAQYADLQAQMDQKNAELTALQQENAEMATKIAFWTDKYNLEIDQNRKYYVDKIAALGEALEHEKLARQQENHYKDSKIEELEGKLVINQ